MSVELVFCLGFGLFAFLLIGLSFYLYNKDPVFYQWWWSK